MSMEKTFDAAEAEARIAAMWEEGGCFAAGANAREGADPFCIVIPPPNVTGSLHMGHALNNTLQDILIRWKRMQGFDTLWQPGQDHAGIATQMVVERKLAEEGNQSRRDMGREKFLERVWEWKAESGDTIINQLKRLGASCDWSRNRFTMDEGLSRAVLKVFVQLYKEGLIYRDKRLVNWDPHFETAISDLEVEQVEIRPSKTGGKLWRFRYPLADGVTYTYREILEWDEDGKPTAWGEPEERDYIVVATTRPETMLGDTGVAVHPDDPRFKDIVGKEVLLPLVGRRIPIVADEYADPTKGAGAVKITPAHDFNDFEVGKRCGLPAINIFDTKANVQISDDFYLHGEVNWEPGLPKLDGLDRYEARLKIIETMEARGLLDGIDDEPHLVPHGDRSKVAIEPYLTDQWFVDAKTLAQPALAAVRSGETSFAPQNWEKTYFNWLENIEPWCISRQLWWGHQIPVWYAPNGKNGSVAFDNLTIICEESEQAAIAEAEKKFKKRIVVVQNENEAADLILSQLAPAKEKYGNISSEYERAVATGEGVDQIPIWRDDDVLDTWFSSALWPFSTLGWPDKTPELARYYKTSVLVTGFDIIFFWVARMMMAGLHFMKDEEGKPEVPFHTVYVHALVRDEKGKKMSKTLGNVIDPLDLIEQYGADALRFTLTSMAAMGRDIKLAVNRVEGYRNFGTKLWNAARFAEMNGCVAPEGFDPKSAKETVNRWIVGETARLREAADAALESYRFNDYAGALYTHVWRNFCDWYLELAKPLLQGEDGPAKDETRAVAAWALDQILLIMHPVSPFITEELWQVSAGETGRSKPLVHGDWPAYSAAEMADPEADAEIGWVIRLIDSVRSVRAEMNVPPSAQVDLTILGADEAAKARLARNDAQIRRLARAGALEASETAPTGAITVALGDQAVCLDLAGHIDIAAEKARLSKAREKAAKEVKGLEGKLSNQAFLAKAPEEVVEEQRERLEAARAEADRLGAALERLSALG